MQDPAAPVSWRIGTTVVTFAERVDALPVDDATQGALEVLRNGKD